MTRTKQRARRGLGKRKRDVDREDEDSRKAKRPTLEKKSTNSSHTAGTDNEEEGTDKTKEEHSPDPDAAGDPALLADHFAKCVRRSFPDSSSVELDEQYLPTKAFLDTTGFDKDRVAANLPEFLKTFTDKGGAELSTCKEQASPHTLVITLSGIRTADLSRELRVFGNEKCKVGKLIAKHMKLKKNIKDMQKNKIGIAVSTPFRFKQLLDADAMKTADLRRIVVDGSYRDSKRNTVFTMDQTCQALVNLLNEKTLRQRFGNVEDKIDILVF